jgi:hypothetical protein
MTTLTITVELPDDITPDELASAIWDQYENVEHADRTTAAVARATALALCDAYNVNPAHDDVTYVRERLGGCVVR